MGVALVVIPLFICDWSDVSGDCIFVFDDSGADHFTDGGGHVGEECIGFIGAYEYWVVFFGCTWFEGFDFEAVDFRRIDICLSPGGNGEEGSREVMGGDSDGDCGIGFAFIWMESHCLCHVLADEPVVGMFASGFWDNQSAGFEFQSAEAVEFAFEVFVDLLGHVGLFLYV